MKKFIAPEVRVIRYDSSILCDSIGVGGELGPGDGDVEFEAPRRRGIFDDQQVEDSKAFK